MNTKTEPYYFRTNRRRTEKTRENEKSTRIFVDFLSSRREDERECEKRETVERNAAGLLSGVPSVRIIVFTSYLPTRYQSKLLPRCWLVILATYIELAFVVYCCTAPCLSTAAAAVLACAGGARARRHCLKKKKIPNSSRRRRRTRRTRDTPEGTHHHTLTPATSLAACCRATSAINTKPFRRIPFVEPDELLLRCPAVYSGTVDQTLVHSSNFVTFYALYTTIKGAR